MSRLVFYEKPGCAGNRQQKALLNDLGYKLQVRDLLAQRWTSEKLRPFFGQKPVNEWFNMSAPKIKSGEIDIHVLDEQQALSLMITEPLLIRRPLMELGAIRQSGFDAGPVLNTLGVELDDEEDLQSCPMIDTNVRCEVQA